MRVEDFDTYEGLEKPFRLPPPSLMKTNRLCELRGTQLMPGTRSSDPQAGPPFLPGDKPAL
jgi:hypothetical protein